MNIAKMPMCRGVLSAQQDIMRDALYLTPAISAGRKGEFQWRFISWKSCITTPSPRFENGLLVVYYIVGNPLFK